MTRERLSGNGSESGSESGSDWLAEGAFVNRTSSA
jgi:hypothetical protein